LHPYEVHVVLLDHRVLFQNHRVLVLQMTSAKRKIGSATEFIEFIQHQSDPSTLFHHFIALK
jgi:hypothetical protein